MITVGYDPGLGLLHLGFDVEGSTANLGPLLEILDRHRVKTTMFIVGAWAEANPYWIQEFVRRGHELASHSYSHSNLRDFSKEQISEELRRTEEISVSLTGQSTKPWLRPPYGGYTSDSVQSAYESGWTTITWTGSTLDTTVDASEETMCSTLRSGTFPGSILYTHPYHPEMPATVDRFIGDAQSRGYIFVPLSVLLAGNPGAFLTQ